MGLDTRIEDLMAARRLNFQSLSRELKKQNRGTDPAAGPRFPRAKLAQSTVRRWCRGEAVPRLEEAVLLAEVFGVSLDALVDDLYAPGRRGAAGVPLTPDEQIVLEVYHAYGLSTRKVIALMAQAEAARLNAASPAPAPDYTPGNPGRHPHRRDDRGGNQRTG